MCLPITGAPYAPVQPHYPPQPAATESSNCRVALVALRVLALVATAFSFVALIATGEPLALVGTALFGALAMVLFASDGEWPPFAQHVHFVGQPILAPLHPLLQPQPVVHFYAPQPPIHVTMSQPAPFFAADLAGRAPVGRRAAPFPPAFASFAPAALPVSAPLGPLPVQDMALRAPVGRRQPQIYELPHDPMARAVVGERR